MENECFWNIKIYIQKSQWKIDFLSIFYPIFLDLCHFIQLWKITPFFSNYFFGLWGGGVSPCLPSAGVPLNCSRNSRYSSTQFFYFSTETNFSGVFYCFLFLFLQRSLNPIWWVQSDRQASSFLEDVASFYITMYLHSNLTFHN